MGGQSSESTSTSTNNPKPASFKNPFYTTVTDRNGNTTTKFVSGTAGEQAYNYVNQNLSGLLQDYLNPNINSATNQAKLNQFKKQQAANLQNNIISPLANRNMIRSSQATNMYNNLSNQAADYTNNLIANSQQDTWNMINNLVNLYSQAYSGMANDASNTMNYSIGAGTTTTNTKGRA